jgi:hypothetical protein
MRYVQVILFLGITMVISVSQARADSVDYTFSGTNVGLPGADGLSVALEFISPTPITSLTDVFASQLVSCTNCLVSATVPAVEFRPNDPTGPAIGFIDITGTEFFYRFAPDAFSTAGTFTSLAGSYPGTLTVTFVPEPSTVISLLAGLLTLACFARWKLRESSVAGPEALTRAQRI